MDETPQRQPVKLILSWRGQEVRRKDELQKEEFDTASWHLCELQGFERDLKMM